MNEKDMNDLITSFDEYSLDYTKCACDYYEEYLRNYQKEKLQLQNNWNELKKWLESWLENDKHCYLAENPIDKCRCEVYKELLNKMQELEQGKDE